MFTISSVPQVVYCFSRKANWFNWFHGNQRPTNFSNVVIKKKKFVGPLVTFSDNLGGAEATLWH